MFGVYRKPYGKTKQLIGIFTQGSYAQALAELLNRSADGTVTVEPIKLQDIFNAKGS